MSRKFDGPSRLNAEMVRATIIEMKESYTGDLYPELIADEVNTKVDPNGLAPVLKTHGYLMYLRQLARQGLRTWGDECDGETTRQFYLQGFEANLQSHYPIGDGGTYRRIENLTVSDYQFNIRRLFNESEGKRNHARALEAQLKTLMDSGHFAERKAG
jgi:hypothetical protein